MIDKVSIASVKNNNTPKRDNNTQKNPAFKGKNIPVIFSHFLPIPTCIYQSQT